MRRLLPIVVLLALLPASASASPITYAFQGHVTLVGSNFGTPLTPLPFWQIGDPFIGTITFDPDGSWTGPGNSPLAGVKPYFVDAQATFTIGQYGFSLNGGSAGADSRAAMSQFVMVGSYTNGSLFDPNPPPGTGCCYVADRGWFSLDLANGTGSYNLILFPSGAVAAQIDSIAAVPEPATLMLVTSGLVGGFVRRRRQARAKLALM